MSHLSPAAQKYYVRLNDAQRDLFHLSGLYPPEMSFTPADLSLLSELDSAELAQYLQDLSPVLLNYDAETENYQHSDPAAQAFALAGLLADTGLVDSEILIKWAETAAQNHLLEAAQQLYYQALEGGGALSLAKQAHIFKALGDLDLTAGALEKATEHYYRASILYEVFGFKLGQANCLQQLAALKSRLRQPQAAHVDYQRALSLYAEMGFEAEQANTLFQIGALYLNQKDYQAALEAYQRAYDLYQQIAFWVEQAAALKALGDVYLALGNSPAAQDAYNQALNYYETHGGSLYDQAALWRALAGLNLHEGKLNIARGHLVAAAERYNELGATAELLSVYTLLAHLYLDLEKQPQALTQIALADAQLNSLNDPLAIHEAQSALRHVSARLGGEFPTLWRAHLADQALPTWFSTTPLREAEALNAWLNDPPALQNALLTQSAEVLHELGHLSGAARGAWLETALSRCQNLPDTALAERCRALLLKEMASLPGADPNATLNAALNALDAALQAQSDDPAACGLTLQQRVALLRDMAGMSGENRRERLYQALESCGQALDYLQPDPLSYAQTLLTQANLLRELAGLRGEDRAHWMLSALAAYDEALVLLLGAPALQALTHANRASLLQEIARLAGQDSAERLKQAVSAAMWALHLAEQHAAPEAARSASRLLDNLESHISQQHSPQIFEQWRSDSLATDG